MEHGAPFVLKNHGTLWAIIWLDRGISKICTVHNVTQNTPSTLTMWGLGRRAPQATRSPKCSTWGLGRRAPEATRSPKCSTWGLGRRTPQATRSPKWTNRALGTNAKNCHLLNDCVVIDRDETAVSVRVVKCFDGHSMFHPLRGWAPGAEQSDLTFTFIVFSPANFCLARSIKLLDSETKMSESRFDTREVHRGLGLVWSNRVPPITGMETNS